MHSWPFLCLSPLSSIKVQTYWSAGHFVFTVAIVTLAFTNIKPLNLTLVDYRLWQPWPGLSTSLLSIMLILCMLTTMTTVSVTVVVAIFTQYCLNSVWHQRKSEMMVYAFWLEYHIHWYILLRLSKEQYLKVLLNKELLTIKSQKENECFQYSVQPATNSRPESISPRCTTI